MADPPPAAYRKLDTSALPGRNGKRGGQNRRDAAKNFGFEAFDKAPDILYGRGIAPSGGRQNDQTVAGCQAAQHLRERASDMEERHAKKQIGSRPRLEQEIAGPSLIDLIGVSVADKLRCAGRASGVKVSRGLLAGNPPVADKPVRRLLLDQIAEGINPVGGIAGTVDLHDGLEVLQLATNLLDLLPNVRSGHRAKRNQDLGIRSLEDFHDLMRLQKRVDGIGDAGCFGAEQRDKGLW
jgi:hypothetical protein